MRPFILFFLAIFLTSPAHAETFNKAESIAYIQNLAKQVTDIAKQDTDPKVQDEQVGAMLDNNLAYNQIASFVLGKYWRVATEEEKKEFIDLYAKSLRIAYSRQVLSVDLKDVDVYDALPSASGKIITVKTKITDAKSGQPVAIDWRVVPLSPDHKVVDVLIEGISVASSQRSEYASIIQRGGGEVEAVLAKLRQDVQKSPDQP